MSTGDILVLEHVCKSFGARPVVQLSLIHI